MGPGLVFMQHITAFVGRERYYSFYSFHLRTIRLKLLQTLESGNVHLGIKEFR